MPALLALLLSFSFASHWGLRSSLIGHYGDSRSVNEGWTIGLADDAGPECGYETRGEPGFFCHFED